jgi:hypothetical protein
MIVGVAFRQILTNPLALHDPELTAERIVTKPFDQSFNGRVQIFRRGTAWQTYDRNAGVIFGRKHKGVCEVEI